MTDIVNAVFVRDESVLLAKRGAHRKNYANTWSFPGGHVEPGETLEQALIREVGEETAARPVAFEKIASIADPHDATVVYHMFIVTNWAGDERRLIGDEHSEARWLDLSEAAALDNLALPDYRQLFDQLSRHTRE